MVSLFTCLRRQVFFCWNSKYIVVCNSRPKFKGSWCFEFLARFFNFRSLALGLTFVWWFLGLLLRIPILSFLVIFFSFKNFTIGFINVPKKFTPPVIFLLGYLAFSKIFVN